MTASTLAKPITPDGSPNVSTKESSSSPAVATDYKRKNRKDEEDAPVAADVLLRCMFSRPVYFEAYHLSNRVTSQMHIQGASLSLPHRDRDVLGAYYYLMPLSRTDRASCTHALETIEEGDGQTEPCWHSLSLSPISPCWPDCL